MIATPAKERNKNKTQHEAPPFRQAGQIEQHQTEPEAARRFKDSLGKAGEHGEQYVEEERRQRDPLIRRDKVRHRARKALAALR